MTAATPAATRGAPPARARHDEEMEHARKWARTRPQDGPSLAQTITYSAVAAYWEEARKNPSQLDRHPLRPLPTRITLVNLPAEALETAQSAGRKSAGLGIPKASHALGALYTGTMPKKLHSRLGAYYTPPPRASGCWTWQQKPGSTGAPPGSSTQHAAEVPSCLQSPGAWPPDWATPTQRRPLQTSKAACGESS